MLRNLRRTNPKSGGWSEGMIRSQIRDWEQTYCNYLRDAQNNVEHFVRAGANLMVVRWYNDYKQDLARSVNENLNPI